jgi:hypothetical protein
MSRDGSSRPRDVPPKVPTNYGLFSSPLIKVIVGNPECDDANDAPQVQTFFVHKDALVSASPFFAKALRNYEPDDPDTLAAWVEAETGVIKLPEDEPEVFANYLELVYHKTVHSFIAPDSAGLRNDSSDTTNLVAYYEEFRARVWKYQTSLCLVYVFAEKVQDITAKKLLLTALVESTSLEDINYHSYLPMSEQVNIIYNGVPSSDPIREFLTDCYVSLGRESLGSGGWPKASLYHPEFLDDVMDGLWQLRPRPKLKVRKNVRVASNYVQKLNNDE